MLQIAVFLFYISAVFGLLFGGASTLLGLALVIGSVLAGLGIANLQRWGYYLGLAISVLGLAPYVLLILDGRTDELFGGLVISLIFDVARFVLLVHPESRTYQRIWFEPSKPSSRR